MSENAMKATSETATDTRGVYTSLDELRDAALNFGVVLKNFGKQQVAASGDGPVGLREELLHKSRQLLQDVERQLGALEHRAEENMREHPRAWLGGFVGIISAGLLLGMILRRRG